MNSRNARILVVDDEPQLRELLTDALADDGVTIACAASGNEAIALAAKHVPDLLITDLNLGDCTGLDVIDNLRSVAGDIPAVVITGMGDAKSLSEASRRRPVEMLNKPLDLQRLRDTVTTELSRLQHCQRLQARTRRLRRLARQANHERRVATRRLNGTCVSLTEAYRSLAGQLATQNVMIDYQRQLLAARNDDDVFRTLFDVAVKQSGPLFGMAMVCDANAELQMVGRFGVPRPDGGDFCRTLAKPLIGSVLAQPRSLLLDAQDEIDLFDESIRRYLIGVTVLALPLLSTPQEMIGLVVLYRKGEQPFTDRDVALMELLAAPAAMAVSRND
jgi:CheY-like chemotaxis protein